MVLEDRKLSTRDGISGEVPLILVLYVDDLFLTGDERFIRDCNSNLTVEFEMKDLGLMHYFMGLDVFQRDGSFFIGQAKYAIDILKRFRMEGCKPMAIPLVSN